MLRRSLAVAGLLAVSNASYAVSNIDALQNLGALSDPQASFLLLSEDLTAALSYKALSPAEPLGITGFDIGVEVTSTKLQNAEVFQAATNSSDSWDQLPLPKLHVHKGLPLDFDIGVMYTEVSDMQLVGAELKYAILDGGVAMPAIALRGAYSKLSGVDQLDFTTKSAELSISKGFAMVTPYAGAGKVWATSTPKAEAVTVANLTEEEVSLTKVFAGLNLNLGLVNFLVEGDKTGEATTYGAKFGLRF